MKQQIIEFFSTTVSNFGLSEEIRIWLEVFFMIFCLGALVILMWWFSKKLLHRSPKPAISTRLFLRRIARRPLYSSYDRLYSDEKQTT